jgi:hypothetical protein
MNDLRKAYANLHGIPFDKVLDHLRRQTLPSPESDYQLSLKNIGSEGTVLPSEHHGTAYKLFHNTPGKANGMKVGEMSTAYHPSEPNPELRIRHVDAQNRSDLAHRLDISDQIPGHAPFEPHGETEHGHAVVKMPFLPYKGRDDDVADWIDHNPVAHIKNAVATKLNTEFQNDNYLAIGRDGKPYLLSDVNAKNFRSDADGKPWLTDAMPHELTPKDIQDHPALKQALDAAIAKKKDLEDRGGAVHAAGFQKQEDAVPGLPGFYSHLSRMIDAKMPNKASSDQVRAMLKGNGVKDDEIKWSGVDDYLREDPTATKADLQRFLKEEGGVKIQTTHLGYRSLTSEESDRAAKIEAKIRQLKENDPELKAANQEHRQALSERQKPDLTELPEGHSIDSIQVPIKNSEADGKTTKIPGGLRTARVLPHGDPDTVPPHVVQEMDRLLKIMREGTYRDAGGSAKRTPSALDAERQRNRLRDEHYASEDYQTDKTRKGYTNIVRDASGKILGPEFHEEKDWLKWYDEQPSGKTKTNYVWRDEKGVVQHHPVADETSRESVKKSALGALNLKKQRARDDAAHQARIKVLDRERKLLGDLPQQLSGIGRESDGDTKHENHQLPGGENYREQVFSIPSRDTPIPFKQTGGGKEWWTLKNPNTGEALGLFRSELEAQNAIGISDITPKTVYISSHFPDVPNYLAHMRLNDRTDAEGQPGTLIEEMQSDRGQKWLEARDQFINEHFPGKKLEPTKEDKEKGILKLTDTEAEQAREHARSVIPTGPMVEDTTKWAGYLFRKALGDAVASGKKWIGWTTGDTQADRYDLAKQVDAVKVRKRADGTYNVAVTKKGESGLTPIKEVATEAELPDLVGKDLASKIAQQEVGPIHSYEGADLKVGGEGMKGFYDKIVPQYVEKYAKKWGVKPEQAEIKTGTGIAPTVEEWTRRKWEEGNGPGSWDQVPEEMKRDILEGNADYVPEVEPDKAKIWKLPINEAMRESIEKEGQPIFAAGFKPSPDIAAPKNEGFAARQRRLAQEKESKDISEKALGFSPAKKLYNALPKDIHAVIDGIKAAADSIAKTWIPHKRSEEAAFTGRSLSAAIAKYDALMNQADHDIAGARKYLDSKSLDFNHSVIAAIENNQAHPDPVANAFCETMRQTNNKFRDMVRNMPNTHFKNMLVNYFPHIWAKEDLDAATKFYQRKIEGSRAFLKHRTIPTVQEGLDAGLHLAADNPADLFMVRWSQMSKYMAGQEMLHDIVTAGIAKPFTGDSTALPPGMKQVDDRLGLSTIEQPVETKDSMAMPDKLAGNADEAKKQGQLGGMEQPVKTKTVNQHYYAPESVVTLLDNHLSPGLRDKAVYKVINGMANTMNQAQLGFSAFHLGFTALDMATSKLAYGLEEALSNHDLGASARAIASVPAQLATPVHILAGYFSPKMDTHIGSRISKELDMPGSQGNEIAALANAVIQGGGGNKMDPFYANQMIRSFQKAWRTGNKFGAAWRAPFAAIEAASRPIMEYIVPRQKLAVFADLARMQMKKLGPDAGADDVRKAMQSAWASVDNRMGQLRYDNLYWNKTAKDIAMITTRSVGWNLGSYRELLGGLGDWAKQGGKVATGKFNEAEFTHKMAYTLALPMFAGSVGAMINYLYTGEAPKELRDYFFPKTGEKNGEGHNVRLALPTYMKDVYGFAHQPGQTLENKANPVITSMLQLWNNKDFYGTEIRQKGDNPLMQAAEALGFVGKSLEPFALSGRNQLASQGASTAKQVLPFFGLTPANAWIDKSDAELKASELNQDNMGSETRTSADADKAQKKSQVEQQLEANDPMKGGDTTKFSQILRSAVQDGTIPREDVARTLKTIRKTPLERQFEPLHYDQAVQVWNLATRQEKEKLLPLFRAKLEKAREDGEKVDSSILKLAN